MVLIDSATDLMATASRDHHVASRLPVGDRTGSEDAHGVTRNYDPWRDIYLQGAYQKRFKDLEQFAKEKTDDYQQFDPYLHDYDNYQYTDFDEPALLGNRLYKRKEETQKKKNKKRRKNNSAKEKQDQYVYDYVDPLTFNDFFRPSESSLNEVAASGGQGGQYYNDWQQPSLTRRVANAIFSPVGRGLFAILAIPIMLAAGYYLFVVNGPTPVVKARIEDAVGSGSTPGAGAATTSDPAGVLEKISLAAEGYMYSLTELANTLYHDIKKYLETEDE